MRESEAAVDLWVVVEALVDAWHADKNDRALGPLSLEQVQEILNLGSPAVYSLVRSGESRAAQSGGRNIWRVREDDLAVYIEAAYAKTAESIASGQIPDGEASTS